MLKALCTTAALLALSACTHQPESVPKATPAMVALVRAEPPLAAITFLGKPAGTTPTSLNLAGPDEVLNIEASRTNDPLVEKRIRYLSADRAEVIFVFASGHSAMAAALGLPKILVFDYGAGFTFDVDKFELKAEFLPFLDRQATLLNKYFPGLDVFVCGHTDSTGAPEHNLKLSLDRAQSVAGALTSRALSKDRLKVQGLGSQYPIASNDTPEGRTMNRRTEIILPQ